MTPNASDPVRVGEGPVVVSVPARPDFVHVFRTVVAGIAARADFTIDEIDDLRLIVDEACAQLLAYPIPAMALTLEITHAGSSVEMLVSSDADPSGWPQADAEATIGWQVLSALSDDARFEHTQAGPALRVTKHGRPAES